MPANPNAPVPAETTPERSPKGRFPFGNKGGPGNPFARQVAEVRKLLLNAVPGADLTEILLAVVEKAKTGDVAAAKLVLQYTAGKPIEAVDPDRIEIEDHRLRVESSIPYGSWSPAFGVLSAETANILWGDVAEEMERETMLPMYLGGLEVEAAPPHMKQKVQRKATRRTMRILEEAMAPSPNGAIGRLLAKLRRRADRLEKTPAKTARAG